MSQTQVPRVAVLVETSNVYGREIQLGIADYARGHAHWSMFAEQHELGALPPPWLLRQKWDGIISRPTTASLAKVFSGMGVPVVDLNDLHHDLGYPRMQSDNHAIGEMAAEHLRERGFRHYGYCGFSEEAWASERREGYVRQLAAQGFETSCYETSWRGRRALPWAVEQERLAKWMTGLPKPAAIFTCNDVRGRDVLEICRRLKLLVPDQVSVLGVDNDELLCRMSDPPLSSVVPDAHRLGFDAAALLDKLMAGGEPEKMVQRIAPRAVVTRQSTDILAIDDASVLVALKYIHAHACEGICVEDVVQMVPFSRSVLERRFKQCVGRSPHSEIRMVQMRRAAKLLEETDLPLKGVAKQCGIAHMEYLSYMFKNAFGLSPGQYRRNVARDAVS